jgi:hypothetical protein
MRRGGFREDEPITRYKSCQRELRLQIALKPPWRMTACYRLLFYSSEVIKIRIPERPSLHYHSSGIV